MRLLIFLLFSCLGFSSFAQNLSSSDVEIIRNELHRLVNELRLDEGLNPLQQADTLQLAAQIQADYQAEIDEVTHGQKKSLLATPSKRVISVKGFQFEGIGENCASIAVTDSKLKKKELLDAAFRLFTNWKNSPGHYQNMINPNYTLGDFGFALNGAQNRLYATQVFGRRKTQIAGQISSNGWGITAADKDCDEKYKTFDNLVANMGNSLGVEDGNVYLYYSNIAYFDKIFPNENDGLVLDLVLEEQFPCGQANSLDGSEVYDGILLKPVYKNELWSGNIAQSDYRLITKVGEIPAELQDKLYQISVIIIDEGKKCKYLIPAEVPHKKYALRPIEPFVDEPTVELVNKGIIRSQELVYDFDRGIAKPEEYPVLKHYKAPIYSVDIICYTSIEGDTIINNKLHNNRANFIKKDLERNLDFPDSVLHITATENWKQMNFQLQYFFADSLLTWPKDSLRALVRSENDILPWDSLLYAQRRSSAIINYYGELSESSSQVDTIQLNLKTAIATEEWDLANKALYRIYYSELIGKDSLMFQASVFEACKTEHSLLKNAAAVYSQVYTSDVYKTIDFINVWLNRSDELNTEEVSNLMHLYTLVNKRLLNQWDVPASRLANVIHPIKVSIISEEKLQDELVLNLHLAFIEYYGQINDGQGISKSFNFIVSYFKQRTLSPEDDVDLCLFFNSWSMFKMTVDYLLPKFKSNQLNEEGVFLLLKTWWFYGDKENQDYIKVHQKAKEINTERWCNYIKTNYQILRHEKVKTMYCSSCPD